MAGQLHRSLQYEASVKHVSYSSTPGMARRRRVGVRPVGLFLEIWKYSGLHVGHGSCENLNRINRRISEETPLLGALTVGGDSDYWKTA